MRSWILGAILTAGFLVRLVNVSFISQTAFLEFPMSNEQTDMHTFWEWAKTIAAGDWLGQNPYRPFFDWMQQTASRETWDRWQGGKEVFHQAPLYPYFVASLLEMRQSLGFILFVQAVIGSLQPLVMFLLARRLFDERAGLLAAAVTAFYGPFVFYEAVLLRDWLIPLLEPLIVLMALPARAGPTAGRWLGMGCIMGIAALTKETTILLSIAVTLWLVLQLGRPYRQSLHCVGLLVAGFLLCVAPLVIRNALVGAPMYTVSGQGTGSVVLGLLPGTDPVGLSKFTDELGPLLVKTDARPSGMIAEVLRSFHGDYLQLLRHQLLKLRGLLDPYEPPNNNVSYYYGEDISPVLRFAIDYRLVLLLGIVGLLFSMGHRSRYSLLHVYALVALAVQMVTVILSRFRLGLVPVLILGAAFFLTRVVDLSRDRRWGQIVVMWTMVFAVAILQFAWASRYDPSINPGKYWELPDYRVAAWIYSLHGRFDLATGELARFRDKTRHSTSEIEAFSIASAEQGDYHIMWARQLVEQEKDNEARQQIRLAEQVYSEQTLLDYYFYNLGTMYLKLGDHEKGRTFLKQFVELEPEGPQSEKARLLLDRSDHPDEPHRDVSGAEVDTQ